MEKKLIFFDIDGTLLNGKKEVPESTKTALRELREAGHLKDSSVLEERNV